MKQLEGQGITDIETAEIKPIDLGLPVLKEIGPTWLVDIASYISHSPQFIVNGFICSGITGALDAHYSGDQPEQETGDMDESGHDQETDSQNDSDESDEEEADYEDNDSEAVINLESGEEEIYDEDDREAVIDLESAEKESDCADV